MDTPTTYVFNSKYGSTYTVRIQKRFYTLSARRVCLTLIDVEDGLSVCTATVNIPEVALELGEVIIKDYSENAGLLQFLIDKKIVSNPHMLAGRARMAICKLLI